MSAAKQIILITGANIGIGYETAAQLLHDPSKHVIVGSRSAEKGVAAVEQLQALKLPGSVETVTLDVTSLDSIIAAAQEIEKKHGRVDALVNNAGAAIVPGKPTMAEEFQFTFKVNAIGPALVVEQFDGLLKKAHGTLRIVNVSSLMGSIRERVNPESPIYKQLQMSYRTSKAALNMITACQAYEYGLVGGKVFAYDPGFVVSNLSSWNRAEYGAKPTAEAARPIVDLVNGKRDAEHASFVSGTGQNSW